MKIVKANQAGVAAAVAAMKHNRPVVFPTDTAYALGGIFDNRSVQRKIAAIKRRTDPKFTLVAAGLTQVENFFTLSPKEKKLAKKFWPGPLSLVVSKKFAVRVPDSRIARTLARRVGKPLIATSANISGEVTPYTIAAVIGQFVDKKNQPAVLIDAGRLQKRKVSTVLAARGIKPKIIRAGAISASALSKF